jgi:hypothetical protein
MPTTSSCRFLRMLAHVDGSRQARVIERNTSRSVLTVGRKRGSRKPRLARHSTALCFLQADFWPGIISGLFVIRSEWQETTPQISVTPRAEVD